MIKDYDRNGTSYVQCLLHWVVVCVKRGFFSYVKGLTLHFPFFFLSVRLSLSVK